MPKKKDTDSDNPYEVGYGKPPRRTQFKPGQSGNPRGRPRGQPNFKTTLNEVFNEKVTLRVGDRTRSVPANKAILLRIRNGALQGEPKAIAAYLQLIRGEGLLQEAGESKNPGMLEIDDQKFIADYFARRFTSLVEPIARAEAPSTLESTQNPGLNSEEK